MKMRQHLTRGETKRLAFLENVTIENIRVIRTPNDIHPLKERNKIHFKLNEVLCVLQFQG